MLGLKPTSLGVTKACMTCKVLRGGGGGTCATKLSCKKKLYYLLSSFGDKWIDSKAQKKHKVFKSSLEILEGKERVGSPP